MVIYLTTKTPVGINKNGKAIYKQLTLLERLDSAGPAYWKREKRLENKYADDCIQIKKVLAKSTQGFFKEAKEFFLTAEQNYGDDHINEIFDVIDRYSKDDFCISYDQPVKEIFEEFRDEVLGGEYRLLLFKRIELLKKSKEGIIEELNIFIDDIKNFYRWSKDDLKKANFNFNPKKSKTELIQFFLKAVASLGISE